MPKKLRQVVEAIKAEKTNLHDVGIAAWQNDGQQQKRYFVNMAGMGFDGYVTEKVSRKTGWLSEGKMAYTLTTLASLPGYKPTHATISIDGQKHKTEAMTIAVGNCQYNGGGMRQLPFAKFDDGILDMTVIKKMPLLSMFWHFPKIMSGSFVKMKTVETFTGQNIKIESTPNIWLEADGEVLGKGPFEFSVLKRTISVVVP